MTRLGLGDRIGLAAGIVLCVAAAVFAVAYGQSPTPPDTTARTTVSGTSSAR